MKRSQLVLVGSIWAVLGASTLVACGDDSEDDSGQGGSTSTGGKSATGGKTSTGGASTGGTAPGTGGKSATGGAGGSGEPGGGGAAGSEEPGGEAGSGGAVEPGGPITASADVLLEGVNDLRGLTFAADGKIYGSGHIGADNTAVDRKLAIVRLTADGELDDTFGEKGIVSFNLRERVVEAAPEGGEGGAGGGASEGEGGEGGASGPSQIVINDGDEQSLGVVELENGDVIVQANVRDASGKGSDVVLLRLDSDGELVDSFGEKGIQTIDFGWTDDDAAAWTLATGPSDQAWGVSLDNTSGEEKVVVFGFGPAKVGQTMGDPAVQRTDNDRYIARVLADDGSFDPDFNDGEVFSYNSGGTFNDNGRRGLVLEDGSIVSGGYTNYGEGLGNHVLVIQLTPEGAPDPDFGFGIASPGVARTNPFLDDGGVAECYGVAVQKSGRYVTTGYGRATVANGQSSLGWETTDGVDMISVALLPEGNGVDTAWGKQGTFVVQSEGLNLGNTEDRGRDLLALPDDRLVYAGRLGPNPALFVATAKGELDASVGEDGVFSYDALTDPTSHFFRITAAADSKRIVASTNNHADGVLVAILDVGEQ